MHSGGCGICTAAMDQIVCHRELFSVLALFKERGQTHSVVGWAAAAAGG